MTPPEDLDAKPWRGPGPLFWLAMAFALACLIAAAVVALRFGVFAHHPRGEAAHARTIDQVTSYKEFEPQPVGESVPGWMVVMPLRAFAPVLM